MSEAGWRPCPWETIPLEYPQLFAAGAPQGRDEVDHQDHHGYQDHHVLRVGYLNYHVLQGYQDHHGYQDHGVLHGNQDHHVLLGY